MGAAGTTPGPTRVVPSGRVVGLVALGGAAGAAARVAVGSALGTTGGGWPIGTFTANVVGAFLLGILLTVLTDGRLEAVAGTVRPLLATGLLGSFTTFSTLTLELRELLAQQAIGLAVLYAAGSVLAGLLAGLAGIVLARRVRRRGR